MRPTPPPKRTPAIGTGRASKEIIFDVALEFESLVFGIKQSIGTLSSGDKIALASTLGLFCGVMLPWLSKNGDQTLNGFDCGGIFHLILATWSFFVILGMSKKSLRAKSREQSSPKGVVGLGRYSLILMIIGAISLLLGIVLLCYFGAQYWIWHQQIDIRYGFYLTLFFGFGISFGGSLRFIK